MNKFNNDMQLVSVTIGTVQYSLFSVFISRTYQKNSLDRAFAFAHGFGLTCLFPSSSIF